MCPTPDPDDAVQVASSPAYFITPHTEVARMNEKREAPTAHPAGANLASSAAEPSQRQVSLEMIINAIEHLTQHVRSLQETQAEHGRQLAAHSDLLASHAEQFAKHEIVASQVAELAGHVVRLVGGPDDALQVGAAIAFAGQEKPEDTAKASEAK